MTKTRMRQNKTKQDKASEKIYIQKKKEKAWSGECVSMFVYVRVRVRTETDYYYKSETGPILTQPARS